MVQLLVALVVALLVQSAPYHVYLPFVMAQPAEPRKGLAGSASVTQRRDVGANWYHHWSLCNENEGSQCVDVSKGHWTWEEYGEGPDKIEAAMLACRSGWFMFGDEWELQHNLDPAWYPMEQQIEEARWYIEKRDEVNPDCKLAFGGILTFHKHHTPKRIAVHWVPAFYGAYVAEYGEAPDVQAVVLDDYYWAGWFYIQPGHPTWHDITAEAVGAIRSTYGDDVEIWAREIGSLMKHPIHPSKYQHEAMDRLDTVRPLVPGAMVLPQVGYALLRPSRRCQPAEAR